MGLTSKPGSELELLIGEAALIRLAEAFGGTRLGVPAKMSPGDEIAKAIRIEAAQALAERFASDVIRIPLAREARARHYRASGESNAQIARALGVTESSVERLFQRMPDAPAKGIASASPASTPNR